MRTPHEIRRCVLLMGRTPNDSWGAWEDCDIGSQVVMVFDNFYFHSFGRALDLCASADPDGTERTVQLAEVPWGLLYCLCSRIGNAGCGHCSVSA